LRRRARSTLAIAIADGRLAAAVGRTADTEQAATPSAPSAPSRTAELSGWQAMEPAKATAPKRPDPRQALADPSLPAAGSCRLRITIISAEGLKDADMTTRSDPFCVCKILTMDKPEFQTAVIKDNNNPVWNHRHVIVEYMPGDPLELKVYDHDEKAKPELLGVAQVASGTFFLNGLDKGELKLSGRGARGTLNVRIENLGSAAAFAAADRARREALLELRAAGPHRLRVSLLSASRQSQRCR